MESLCSDPLIAIEEKPLPYSNPFTALIESIALPNSAWSLSKTGSPSPAGTFFISQVTLPPTVSPSFLIALINVSISSATFCLDNEQCCSLFQNNRLHRSI